MCNVYVSKGLTIKTIANIAATWFAMFFLHTRLVSVSLLVSAIVTRMSRIPV